ncbi:MAG: recombinase family protein [Acidimicrobiales bacterium]
MTVGIYTRTEAGGTVVVAAQRQVLRRAVEADGDEVAAEFVDDGYSWLTLDRSGLGALRDAVRCGSVEAVWCLSADRPSRDHCALAALVAELAQPRHGWGRLASQGDDDGR